MAINAATLEQTGTYLERRVRRWDRRLRLVQSAIWLPRGLIAGLIVAVALASVARTRVWLLPRDVALLSGAVIAAAGLLALLGVWLRPQPLPRLARTFDRRFGLKDRVSTALELVSGSILAVESMAERQLDDAVRTALGVNAAARLPIRVRWRELIVLVALAGALAYLLLAPNPRADELRAQQALDAALAEQAQALDATIEEIEQDGQLTQAEKDALTEPLKEARDTLNQQDVTQPEAVAALAEAGQSLKELSDGMLPEQQQDYEQAAQSLDGSQMTQPLSDALSAPDLQQAAQASDQLGEAVDQNELSEAEREDLANRLDQAADALEQSNPALAEQMRKAADALREGDTRAAQDALSQAAEALREQQQQLDQSSLSEQAQSAQQQTSNSQQQIAQAGQTPQDGQSAPETGPGQQSAQQQGSQTGQQQGQQQGQSAQEGEPGAEGQAGLQSEGQNGDAQAQGESGQSLGNEAQGGEGEGQPQGAESEGQGSSGAQQGAQSGEGASGDAQQSAFGAGQGEGGAGNDDTSGVQQDGAMQPGGGSGDTSGDPGDYESPYNPSTIGGQSSDQVDVGGEVTDPNALPVQQGEFGPNPSGESSLSYTGVYGNYQGAVSDALTSPRIPLGQRDVIHDYFSALEP
ncbi:MAG TPA: hypothetical protein PKD09_04280 [Aggregatilinea sp.]|uniref:hypothetical protein n=1 Tax=Aggregatilinea sp. TaxID=2806333 RepID=UPI002B633CA9|nr:hypothetical protein [Aggregatilinea sp.]HML20840.1 hypothetical protein [Aggregatilinea sp.]